MCICECVSIVKYYLAFIYFSFSCFAGGYDAPSNGSCNQLVSSDGMTYNYKRYLQYRDNERSSEDIQDDIVPSMFAITAI